MDTSTVVVIDNGSGTIKAGFSGDEVPRTTTRTVVGRTRATWSNHPGAGILGVREYYVGDEAITKRSILLLRYPIEHGGITDFDTVNRLWEHVFTEELKASSEAHPVLMTDAPFNAPDNRARMAEVAFESLNVPAFNVSNKASLALYATGCTTGIVLDSGEDTTYCTPVRSGIPVITPQTDRLDLGGENLADLLIRRLGNRGAAFLTRREQGIAKDILKTSGYVAADRLDYSHVLAPREGSPASTGVQSEETYTLPDGEKIILGDERFICPEALFQPSVAGYTAPGVHELIHNSITQLNPAIQDEMWANVIITGGNTLFPGFVDRLKAELVALAPPNTTVHLVAPSDRHFATWIGGSILSSLGIFKNMLVTKQEYDEIGPAVFQQRCL